MPLPNLNFILCYLLLCFGRYECQNAEQEMDICQQKNGTIARVVHLTNPNFPRSTDSNKTCRCNIQGWLTVSTNLLISVSHGDTAPLNLKYEQKQAETTWEQGRLSLGEDGKNIIVKNITSLDITMDTFNTSYSVLIFKLDITAGDVLNLTCWETTGLTARGDDPHRNVSHSEASSPNEIMSFLGDLCSPYLVIILGGSCLALLLILLPLAIVVCCITPHRRSKYTLDSSSKVDDKNYQSASKRSDSIVYDDAVLKMCSSGAYTTSNDRRPSVERRAHGRRSNSMPGKTFRRQSGPHYANTTDIAQPTYGNAF